MKHSVFVFVALFTLLFAGCGGFTAGFKQAGYASVAAIEWDPAAAATYSANFGDHTLISDIRDVPVQEY